MNVTFSYSIAVLGPVIVWVDYDNGLDPQYVDASQCAAYPCTVPVEYTIRIEGLRNVRFVDYHKNNHYWNGIHWIGLNNNYVTKQIMIYAIDGVLNMNDPANVHNALVEGYDMSQCASNCSNNGACTIGQNMRYVCDCHQNYTGPTCNVDARPCSAGPCLNNGTCSQTLTNGTYSFNCDCKPNYTGDRCENFDLNGLCAKLSCVKGICKFDAVTSTVSCSCFPMYSGEKCEIESAQMTAIKSTISASAIIAIMSIAITFTLVLISDIIDHCYIRRRKSKILLKKPTKQRFKYKAAFMDSKRYVVHGERREML
jgi:hypothetical protein